MVDVEQWAEIRRMHFVAGLSIKEIASWFAERHGEEYDRKISARWIGYRIRRGLGLKTQKSHGIYVIPRSEDPKLPRLFGRYGIDLAAVPSAPPKPDWERWLDA